MATTPAITDTDIAHFREHGYVVKRRFYDGTVIDLLARVARAEMKDRQQKPEIWDSIPYHQHGLGEETMFNAVCFNERMVSAFERLLHDACRHEPRWGRRRPDPLPGGITLHHRKLIVKDADNHTPEEDLGDYHLGTAKPIGGGYRGGNRFLWHQDFWYWGNPDGVDAYGRPGRPFPDLATCFLAIDPATRENGCLELLSGSHQLGRVEFEIKPWGQRCPTPEAVEVALAAGCEPVFVELDPGDACFFHCEMLHQSAPNSSPIPRWAFLVCFDPMHNAPIGVEDSRQPAPVWDNDCLLRFGARHLAAIS